MYLYIDDITIKPYVRMTKRGKWVDPDAQEYLASKANIQYKIKEQMAKHNYDILPGQTPIIISINASVPKSQGHRCDSDNIIKAVLDAGNGILYPDDRWIDHIVFTRTIDDKKTLSIVVDCLASVEK